MRPRFRYNSPFETLFVGFLFIRTPVTLLVGDCLDVQLVEVDDFRRFLKFRLGTVAHSDDIQ
jgi:hypothetical protein